MVMLTDLADACRKSGLPVVEASGWRTRGHGGMYGVRTLVAHHTATPASASGNYPSFNIVTYGRSDLPGPLAQLGLGRDGTVYVLAAGAAYHAGTVRMSEYSNAWAIGIEAEAPGTTTWPAHQIDAYARLCRALCDHYRVPVSRVLGHKEICYPPGRKIDPHIVDMADFRRRVAAATGEDFDMDKDEAERLFRTLIREELDNWRLGSGPQPKTTVRAAIGQLLNRVPARGGDDK